MTATDDIDLGRPENTNPDKWANPSTGKQAPLRDGKGQYKFTAVDDKGEPTGNVRSYTRCSTIADTLESKITLDAWKSRQLAHGLSLRDDLVKKAQVHNPDEDRDVYEGPDGIIATAMTMAESDSAANAGTTIHRATELVDHGQTNIDEYNEDHRPYLRSYIKTIERSPWRIVPEYIESIVIDDNYKFGGQIDRVVQAEQDVTTPYTDKETGLPLIVPKGDLIIGDLKTGKIAEYKYIEFGTQITGYANHTATWTVDRDHPDGGVRGPRIPVRRDVAIIIHLPSQDPAAPCDLYWVDLRLGLEYFQASIEVRGLRSAPYKRQLITACDLELTPAETAIEWLKGRVAGLETGGQAEALAELDAVWPLRDIEGQLVPLGDESTAADIDAVAVTLDQVEARHGVGFPADDPRGDHPDGWVTKTLAKA